MASTITITCPECDKQMKAPAEVLGKKVKCKGCGTTFPARDDAAAAPTKSAGGKPAAAKPAAGKAGAGKPPAGKAPAGKAAPAKPAKKPAEEDEDNKPYGMTFEKLGNRCPDCANEMESEEAVVCLHCGYNRETRERSKMRKVADVTGGDVFMWLLPGIACALGVLLLAIFDIVFINYADGWVDKDDWMAIFVGPAAKIWLVVVSLFVAYGGGKFAIRRLIYDNKPPEVEMK